MTICQTPGCPASQHLDEFGRRMSVQINDLTQSRLGATGHHVTNRYLDGTIVTHLASWSLRELERARQEVAAERTRAQALVDALAATEDRLTVLSWTAKDREASNPR